MALFGTNGIRGIPNKDFYPDFYLHIAIAIGSAINEKSFAIASDGRKTVAMLRGAVISGLTSTGHDIIDLGTLPVPALQYYCKVKNVPGIMITASHNPPEYNGIKVFSSDGIEVNAETASRIEDLYKSSKYKEIGNATGSSVGYAEWSEVGEVKSDYGAKDLYIKGILSNVDVEAIRKRKLTVLYDCSNGATYEVMPILMKELGIRGIALNATLDSMFPGHKPEPTEENIRKTIDIAKELGVDFGVVFDSDGDRSIFISPDGKYLDGNYTLAVIARSRIKKGDSVVTTVCNSDIFSQTARSIGAEVYVTKIGSPAIARKAVEVNAKLAGEESGGIMFCSHQYAKDGAMALALFAEAAAKNDLASMLDSLPRLYYKRSKVQTTKSFDEIKDRLLNEKHISQDLTDGVKIYFNDTDWVMMRPSGTEPVLRIYAQASSKEAVDAMIEKYKGFAL
ncbi:MAG: phosphoglucosamine mutase [Candidatus Micrarchaeaceae archaeon]